MRVSELVRESGTPLPTVKYYLREGLLPPGRALGATRAEYGPEHLRRLRLIQALTGPGGLPLHRVREVLDVVDRPEGTVTTMLGRAMRALLPGADGEDRGLDGSGDDGHDGDQHADRPDAEEQAVVRADGASSGQPGPRHHRASSALTALGLSARDDDPAVVRLESALAAAERAGFAVGEERLRLYAEHAAAIAEGELADLPDEPAAAVEYAVLGTTLMEPVITALRRIAHQRIVAARPASTVAGPGPASGSGPGSGSLAGPGPGPGGGPGPGSVGAPTGA